MARLSTGARINNAKDDAAGFMISKGLEVEERGLATANTNIQTGLSLLNIAEGSIQTMLSPLYRIRDLALQSANGIYTKAERKAMQDELDALFNEIVRIKNSTQFNGTNLFGKQVYTDKSQTYVDNETEAPAPIATFGLREESEPTPSMASEPVEENEATTPIPMMMSPRAGGNIIEGTITLSHGQSKTISLGDKTYTFTDYNSGLTENTCNYSYDLTTGKLTLSETYYLRVYAANGQEDDIYVENAGNYTNIYTLDMNDKVEINGGVSNGSINVIGGNGNDTLIDNTISTFSYLYGGEGNDIIHINKNNGLAYGENGDDTFYINGNTNTVYGNSNNDNFIIQSGDGNFVAGGDGTNTTTNNGTNTGWCDISGVDDYTPTTGIVHASSAHRARLNFNGKHYTVFSHGGKSIQYSYNEATDTVTIGGSYANIIADDNQINNIILSGDYAVYNAGNSVEDNITSSGLYQTINLGSGTNTIISNQGYASIYSNGGNDTININSNENYVVCTDSGVQNINVIGGNYNIINGANNPNLTITDNGIGTGYINCVGYENSLSKEGTIYLKGDEELDITLMEGTAFEASYTIKNLDTTESNFLHFSCNTTTGEITFDSNDTSMNRIQITAHSGQNDKIIAKGAYLHLYTGDGDDTVDSKCGYRSKIDTGDGDDTLNITNESHYTDHYPEFYTGAGSDTVTIASGVQNIDLWTGDGADTITVNGSNNEIYSEAGGDTIIMNGANNSISTGDDDDIVEINASNESSVIDLGAGADRANINADNTGAIVGGDGDDEFVVASGVSGAFVDGNAGHNTLSGDASNTYTYNITGYDNNLPAKGQIAISGNQELTIEILGQTYTITNRAATSSILKFDYSEADGKMTFDGTSLTIKTPTTQANNVVVNGDFMYFYGGNQADTIVINGESGYAYGEGGADTITLTGGRSAAYGGDGADTIYANGAQNYAYGQNGNDTIVVNGGNAVVQGGADNDTITLNAILGNSSSYIEGNLGDDTINVNSQNNTGKIDAGAGDDTINVNASGNTVLGSDGADTINVYAENTTVEAGAGNNTLGLGASSINYDLAEFTKIRALNNSGTINLNANQELEFEIDGKRYSLFSYSNQTLNYSLNSGILTFEGNEIEISTLQDQDDNLNIIGTGNTISTGNGDDRIVAEGGVNTIDSGAGDNVIIANGEYNTINSGAGNDIISVNGDNNMVNSGAGNDVITASGYAVGINSGLGNDNITVESVDSVINLSNGNNSVIAKGENINIQAGNGDNYLEIDGFGNVINFGNGNNNITNVGDSTTISIGGGNSTINHEGNNSSITTAGGNDTINAYGDGLNIATQTGADTIKLVGNYGIIDSGAGADTILLEGNGNEMSLGADNDNATVLGDSNIFDGNTGYDIITNGGTNTTISNSDELWKAADPFTFQVGSGADENSSITVETGFVIPIIDLNITTADKARNSLDDIDRVIETLTTKMAEIGVSKNRLESAMDANSIAKANIASARSTLADADIAKESMNFIKYQILQNAASSLLTSSRETSYTSLLNIYNSIGRIGR